ncbi:glycosyltransferase family 2 protein [Aequorivita sp. H23M31]|uniref:Glycosyltransferase family 2 protein n=1 Tax=Aequorivita ciconiae TaxID=2494375 RepID=A0A410G289_9FLAO|nr:glycosyltransferase family 2 protein [Aequorivita sp. H23M31]QAA81361.1 glycosyltransferase family 2 protein [Aequorivita sp. H23M31]
MEDKKRALGIVIPYYNAEAHIGIVIAKALQHSYNIVIVNDNSPQPLPENLMGLTGIEVLTTPKNLGVGGATKMGFAHFLKNKNIKVILKLDADDQMDTKYIPEMVQAVLAEECHFIKGNRFRDLNSLKTMPGLRRFGNLWLSFLSKAATGYWNCFDFNNGFLAVSTKTLNFIDLDLLSNNYYFETSLISNLYYQRAIIKEIPMPAIYGNEKSNMKLYKMPMHFTVNLIKSFFQRIWKAYFVYDFNIGTIYILFGTILFSGGLIFGIHNWYYYSIREIPAPTGTIMISVLSVILGFQLLLQAVQFDIFKTPNKS